MKQVWVAEQQADFWSNEPTNIPTRLAMEESVGGDCHQPVWNQDLDLNTSSWNMDLDLKTSTENMDLSLKTSTRNMDP